MKNSYSGRKKEETKGCQSKTRQSKEEIRDREIEKKRRKRDYLKMNDGGIFADWETKIDIISLEGGTRSPAFYRCGIWGKQVDGWSINQPAD